VWKQSLALYYRGIILIKVCVNKMCLKAPELIPNLIDNKEEIDDPECSGYLRKYAQQTVSLCTSEEFNLKCPVICRGIFISQVNYYNKTKSN
jgi:hypothetical protein